ncbi:HAD domain-containing protein [Pseudoduganella umbonata]|uniref:Uncharacterized protein n=1 Tax=Pseudoduganella umbonata TaxID=864828 RepID=A0A4P8HUA6_9BURK|nr:HAD domain-containing protein [Pseudoduganella umbonata]MBB3222114.1 hypothetical protein [Pseudoduganella umbonata]QCP12352.1 hypothetical protein FCL38_19450 [Pseudoduganella umbonata]
MIEAVDYYGPRSGIAETPICFLDFDGVLHPDAAFKVAGRGIQLLAEGHQLFEWAGILEELLFPYPKIKIVLSTSWVPMRSFKYARSCLPSGLQSRVIGATYHSRAISRHEFALFTRGEQVRQYVVRHCLTRWCAIDDDCEGWPEHYLSRFVQTEDSTGISHEAVQNRLREIFASL